jgi:putative membrane protein
MLEVATEIGIPVTLVAAAGAYGWAVVRLERTGALGISTRTATTFVVGLMVVALALVGPIDSQAHELFRWHMVQHLMLVSVAAPLLAIGRPVEVAEEVLGRRFTRPPTPPGLVGSTLVQVSVLMAWHVPWLFELAVHHDSVHALEHVSLLASAFVMWWHLVRSAGAWRGLALIVLFLGSFPPMAYGVGMALARTSWYSSYTLDDQRLAGVIMWAYGGGAVVVGGVGLFASWLATAEVEP